VIFTDSKNSQDSSLVHDFENKKTKLSLSPKIAAIYLIIVAFGIGTGFIFSRSSGGSVDQPKDASSVTAGKSFGSNDKKTFSDEVEGELKKGGIEGEGQYHLVRPGGESQNVYLTSSIVDLSLFEGKKIKIWGQTQKAQYAGWLMDVGRVEVLK